MKGVKRYERGMLLCRLGRLGGRDMNGLAQVPVSHAGGGGVVIASFTLLPRLRRGEI